MRRLVLLLILALSTFLAAAQPHVSTFELESNVVATAFTDKALALAFTNNSIAIFSTPHFELRSSVKLTAGAQPIGMGFLDGSRLAVALNDGTIVYVDLLSGSILGEERAIEAEAYRAFIGGRWAILLSKYNYRTEKGYVKLDRLFIYDASLKAVTLTIDRNSGRLVYVFDVKIVGNLMLLTWIDTTCEICRLDDTFITLFNLTTYDYVFIERFGECKADADAHAMVAVRVYDGKGLYYDLMKKWKGSFEVPGKPLDVRVSGGVGYVLSRDPDTGAVMLFKVYRDTIVKLADLPKGERGYALFILEGEPGIATPSFITVKGFNFNVVTYSIPWTPRVVAESQSWAAILYGRSILSLVRSTVEERVDVTIKSEPYASLRVREVNVTVQTSSDGVAHLKLPPGKYTVEVWKEGFESRTVPLTIGIGDKRITITLELERKEEKPESHTHSNGSLNITVFGADEATIEVLDELGRFINVTRSKTLLLHLQPGAYHVVARFDGCSNYTKVTVRPGEKLEVPLHLECRTSQPITPTEESSVRIMNLSLIRERLMQYTQISDTQTKPLNLSTVRDLDGRTIELSRGAKVLVFFYTKCVGCSLLISRLRELTTEVPIDVVMVAPTAYDDERTLRNYAAEVNATNWTWVLDEGAELATLFNVTAFPTVVLLNNGKVEFMGIGAAGETYYLAEMFLESLSKAVDALGDPAVVAVIAGLLLAYLGRESVREEREV